MRERPNPDEIEHSKELLAYFRHLTTLSTGSLVWLGAFMDKLQENPGGFGLVVAAIILFIGTVLFSVLSQSLAIPMMRHRSDSDGKKKYIVAARTFLVGTMFCFLGALVCMGAFIIINLYC